MGSASEESAKLGTGGSVANRADAPALAPSAQRPRLFNFDAQGLRVVGPAETPWFVAKDVCEVLDIQNHRDTLAKVLDDDEKGVDTIYTLGGPQEMLTVNESGLYALIFRSRKPQARLFRKWVTAEVLPTLRRTGRYAMGPAASRAALPASSDLLIAHTARMCAALLGDQRYAVCRIAELAEAATRAALLPWVITDAAEVNQRVGLACTLRRLFGHPLPLPAGGVATLEAVGRQRHRRFLILRLPEGHS